MTEDRNQPGFPSPRTVVALETLITHFAINDRYREYISEVIFPLGPSLRESLDLGKRHRDTLLSSACHHVLLVIWKESLFVTPADLKALGLSRAFGAVPLNCNSLGQHIAEDKSTVGASIQRVQNYVAIASAYKLVAQTLVRGRQLELSGTQHLHDMFVTIGSWAAGNITSSAQPHSPTLNAKS